MTDEAEQAINQIDAVVQYSEQINQQTPTLEIINEKREKSPKIKTDQKHVLPSDDKVTTAAKDNPQGERYYTYADQGGQPQTPYYQQRVAGQPVYVQGAPPPGNAARSNPYRERPPQRDYSADSFIFGDTFSETDIRNKFVQRVYTILAVQLTYTCGFIAVSIFTPEMKLFLIRQQFLLILAAVTEFSILIAMVCCISVRRTFPINFVLLAIFTIAFAYLMAVVSCVYSTQIVMMSMGITAGVCVFISVFACLTSCDVTTWGTYLCVIGLMVSLFGIIAIPVVIFTGTKIVFLIYAALIAIVFSLYLMYDTQMIMGGRRIELSAEEYILGALTLYVDIMQIFWAILTILGFTRN